MNKEPVLNFAGMQLAIFEMIWPAFGWIEAILVHAEQDIYTALVQTKVQPSELEKEDCSRLLAEIFEAALSSSEARFEVKYGIFPEVRAGYQEAMSEGIFKVMAKEIAPWRLEAGR